MSKPVNDASIWPALEGTRFAFRMSGRRAAPPVKPTEPVGAYAAYLAWLEADAQAAVTVGLSLEPAA